MDVLLFITIMFAIIVTAIVVLVVTMARANSRSADSLVKQPVIVNTKDNQSIGGVLLHNYRDRYTLTNASYLQKGVERSVDGLVHIPTSNIAWIQQEQLN